MTHLEYKDKILRYGPWIRTDICVYCEYEFGDCTNNYWGKACPGCGSTTDLCPEYKAVGKRFCYTKEKKKLLWLFTTQKEEGFWEWNRGIDSGPQLSQQLSPHLNTSMLIALYG